MKLPDGFSWVRLDSRRAGLYAGDEPVFALDGLSDDHFRTLALLRQGCTFGKFLSFARGHGVTPHWARQVWQQVASITQAAPQAPGLTVPTELSGAHVGVALSDPFGLTLAWCLLQSGVGKVTCALSRTALATGELRELGHSFRQPWLAPVQAGRQPELHFDDQALAQCDLLVVNSWAVPDLGSAAVALREDQPHLQVICSPRHVLVGPLVAPGWGACAQCVNLGRGADNPTWFEVAPQLADLEPGPVSPSLLLASASRAGALACDFLTVGFSQPGLVEEFRPAAAVGQFFFEPDPECGCQLFPTAPILAPSGATP